LSFVYKNFDKRIPKFEGSELKTLYSKTEVLQETNKLLERIQKELDGFKFNQILEILAQFADTLNIYIDQQAPWNLKHSDTKETEKVLYVTLEAFRYMAILLIPFVPESAKNMLDQLNVPKDQRSFKNLNMDFALKGSVIDEPKVVFPKICKTL